MSYAGMWYDGIGRPTATANYGTNGDGTPPTRPDSPPESSDTVLVTTTLYGYTFADSQIAWADLLRAEIYPESDDTTDPLGDGVDGVYDRVEYTYNRQGQRITKKDQNETVHQYTYDALGRPTADKVTAVGPGVDDAVRRIATTYEVRGMVATITSYASVADASSSSSSSSGSDAVNQVVFEYDDLGKLVKEYQEHHGLAVLSGSGLGGGLPTTPYVGYEYDDTSSDGRLTKGLRQTALRYPNGRLVHYTYGDSGSTADALSRIDSICDDDSGSPGDVLAHYAYLGSGAIVQVDYQEPDIRYDLAHGSGDDPYEGLDRFGRVVDLLWHNYNTGTDVVRIKHGYDRAGNRLWREDPVAASYGKDFDELYTYDGLYQLATMQRGDLDFTDPDNPVIQSKTFAEDWTLDATGNWSTYRQDTDGDSTWDLDQTRTHNPANEITQISGTSTHVAHDRAGNMTRIPKPDDWNAHFDLTYDAWNRVVDMSQEDNTIGEYAYDGLTRRIVERSSGGQGDETCDFYYTGAAESQVVEERRDARTDPERQFIWGLRYVDDLVLRDRDASDPGDGVLDERLYGKQDQNWNVLAFADVNGEVQERCGYSAYGMCHVLTAVFASRAFSAWGWDHFFGGRRLDSETDLDYHLGKYYHGEAARFLGRERSHLRGLRNAYAYLGGRPTGVLDPLSVQESAQIRGPRARLSFRDRPAPFLPLPFDPLEPVTATCQSFLSMMQSSPDYVNGLHPAVERALECNVHVFCGTCPGAAAGYTYLPDPGGHVHMCLDSAKLEDKPLLSIEAMFIHEAIHVGQYLDADECACKSEPYRGRNPRFPAPISNCESCKLQESPAYQAQAEHLYPPHLPGSDEFYREFVEAGKCFSCGHACPGLLDAHGHCPPFPEPPFAL